MKITLNTALFVAGMAAISLFNSSATAQTSQPTTLAGGGNDAGLMLSTNAPWKIGFSADYSSVAAGSVNFNGAKGNSGAQSADANVLGEFRINDSWFVPVGISSRNLFLGTIPGAPIPNSVDTLGLNVGLGYRVNDQWTIAAAAGPRIFQFDSVDSTDMGVGGMVRATYKWTPTLTLAMGFAVDPDRDVPVLPLAGVRWQIRPDLTLSLMYPRSGLDYRVNSRLHVFTGFDGNFAVFRAEDNLGDKIGMSQYDHALGTYRDFHAGIGAEYRILRGLSASVEGGYSFAREIDYQRIDQTIHFGDAPYIQAGFRLRF